MTQAAQRRSAGHRGQHRQAANGRKLFHPAIGDGFANAPKCIRQHLYIHDLMGEYGFRVQVGRILPLFNINGPIFQRDCNDFAELLSAQT